ncbi:30S ribosome-binding factor RbfA [Asticcacaulis sp. EMRT-3]|uniref:30S ribosome-binding factor RbfA n=1 Tax=Asticcacaulis sp. EMRT-3 TaxID=3040349 RepID=UPI0024AF4BD0|nr:30S ribosome-binding factor RbfA [Asticcacaulis sp. EMRT-3]MDI7775547.1 30S ribosome-binding factor RbfA [Asticcacaulis sp. EMRT-3]
MGAMKKAYPKDKGAGRGSASRPPADLGPTQRQLRAGELVRHALVEILREYEIHDEELQGVSITVTEVRCSPDLRHATVFVEPLGAGLGGVTIAPEKIGPAVEALNRHAKFLRGVLGRVIDMKFTPALRFLHDESFNEAARIDALFMRPEIARDLRHDDGDEGEDSED